MGFTVRQNLERGVGWGVSSTLSLFNHLPITGTLNDFLSFIQLELDQKSCKELYTLSNLGWVWLVFGINRYYGFTKYSMKILPLSTNPKFKLLGYNANLKGRKSRIVDHWISFSTNQDQFLRGLDQKLWLF